MLKRQYVLTKKKCPATKDQRPNLSYSLYNPITNKEVIHPTNAWKYEKATYEQHVSENKLYWGKNGENSCRSATK